jgi:hypothetical protein
MQFHLHQILFVNSCYFFLNYWSLIQKVTVYAHIKVFSSEFQHFRPYIKVFDPFWIYFCTRREIGIQFQSSTCGYLVFLTFCWRGWLFTIVCFCHLWQESHGFSCVGLSLGHLSVGLWDCFCASNTLVFVTMALVV